MRVRDFITIVSLFALVFAAQAFAQTMFGGGVDLSLYALKSELPQPGDIIPPTDTLNGAIGSSARYMRQDAPRPTISQRANVTTDVNGNWSITWAKSFVSSTPIVVATTLNSGGAKSDCKVSTRSANSATGFCWQEGSILTVLGLNVLGPSVVYANSSIMVIGLEPSQ